ncbi:YugN family protein [Gracilibacillus sp. YIM 98692]|uniref:YugN family protein n=1 Tax=Gracilibacillus sp. YIM 98692 TaxID=2663532 RepID=UPI0013D69105|nr:YugN family protein [Gracilibacillus sp. YIM 98692]
MHEIDSVVENKRFPFRHINALLSNQGFVLGGAWDYDHGLFDKKIEHNDGYHFLRIPFQTIEGDIEVKDAIIQLGKPYLLTHLYQNDVEGHADSGVFQGPFNQFQSPVEKDADIPSDCIEIGEQALEQVEKAIAQIDRW